MVTIGGLIIVLMTQMGEDVSKRSVLGCLSVCLLPMFLSSCGSGHLSVGLFASISVLSVSCVCHFVVLF